jgi:DNA end-binding protein Ku
MPAPSSRPIWKGNLRLSLVSIPVELYSATKASAKIAFHQIHEPTGKRIRYEKTVTGVGPVDKDEILKGYEYQKGKYVLLTDKDLDSVKLETRKTFDLAQFVGACDIEPIYFDKPYFVVPQDELAEEAYRVVRDALKKSQKVGLGQLAMRGKEYLAALKPCGRGMILETLHYEQEIRKADPFFSDISTHAASKDLLSVAEELIDRKTGRFDASEFKNHYAQALRELVDKKVKGKGKTAEPEEEEERPSGDNVIDLMAALKKSLEGKGRGSAAARSAPHRRETKRARGGRKSARKRTAHPARKVRKSA